MRIRFSSAAVSAALGTALALGIVAVPAQATETATGKALYDGVFHSANDSASLSLEQYAGGRWRLCDDDPDGMRARAQVRNSSGALLLDLTDSNGSNNACADGYIYPTPLPNTQLRVEVWVQNGAGGSKRYPSVYTYYW
ncbi:hypothetical protein [Embleya sp. NPDC020886]|uniref:hypothetical protein n=1 Tax=Embleya sp. NPDC020886 TaxID=3363980 RepID=UPI0037AF74E1